MTEEILEDPYFCMDLTATPFFVSNPIFRLDSSSGSKAPSGEFVNVFTNASTGFFNVAPFKLGYSSFNNSTSSAFVYA